MHIDFDPVAEAMAYSRQYDEFFLDTSSGKVIAVSRDVIEAVEDDDAETMSDSLAQMINIAESYIFDPHTPLITIPYIPLSEKRRLVGQFADQVENARSRTALEEVMNSSSPFRRMNVFLKMYPELEELWNACQQEFMHAEARKWIDSVGLLPTE